VKSGNDMAAKAENGGIEERRNGIGGGIGVTASNGGVRRSASNGWATMENIDNVAGGVMAWKNS